MISSKAQLPSARACNEALGYNDATLLTRPFIATTPDSKLMLSNTALVSCGRISLVFAWILSALLPTVSLTARAQDGVVTSPAVASKSETWFGWISTPKQQLRTIVRLNRDEAGNAIGGFVVSPDQTPEEIPISDLKIDAYGAWSFKMVNSGNASRTATFTGKQSSPDRVAGDFEQVGQRLPLELQKVDSLPAEKSSDLGADTVWLGTLNLVVRKMDFRIRIYSKRPYATPKAPRLLFDSLSEKAFGIPAEVSIDADGKTTFDMKSLGAKFVARLNQDGDELQGRFIQGPLPLELVMKLQAPAAKDTVKDSMKDSATKSSNKKLPPSPSNPNSAKVPALAEGSPLLLEGETLLSPKKIENASSEFFTESSFKVVYGATKPKSGKEPTVAEKGIQLAGTVTIPKIKDGTTSRKFAAVIMVSGSGPQDRDETIGRHKPFQAIAHFLAKNGIASLRYDDRGVGESAGDFLNATSEDFANDAIAVWNYAKTIPEIDPASIGILGHSEGGLVGPMAAVWEPGIAFLILLAPPGVTGSEILKSQIDRMSELQGMSKEDRKATMDLQGKLQDIASGYFTDEPTMRREIQNAINKNWDSLKSIAQSQNPNADLENVKADLTSQIEGQFQQLRMPWYRFFLSYDPSPNWMMIRCPTLAIWGSMDVQVLPELNSEKIGGAIARNQNLDAQLTVLPGLNHLFQQSVSGLPEEYDEIEQTISPTALDTIRNWAKEKGFIP